MPNAIRDGEAADVLRHWPWIGTGRRREARPDRLLLSVESEAASGRMRMDQLLSSFAERRFGARFVRSEWIPCPAEVSDAAA
jgi:CRISPR system Cascade subunit CasD